MQMSKAPIGRGTVASKGSHHTELPITKTKNCAKNDAGNTYALPRVIEQDPDPVTGILPVQLISADFTYQKKVIVTYVNKQNQDPVNQVEVRFPTSSDLFPSMYTGLFTNLMQSNNVTEAEQNRRYFQQKHLGDTIRFDLEFEFQPANIPPPYSVILKQPLSVITNPLQIQGSSYDFRFVRLNQSDDADRRVFRLGAYVYHLKFDGFEMGEGGVLTGIPRYIVY